MKLGTQQAQEILWKTFARKGRIRGNWKGLRSADDF